MKLPAIDVLRGVAALGVAWYHSRVDLWVGFKAIQADPAAYSWFDRAISWVSLPVSQMGAMVMLFFVLSGFCIHLPIAGRAQMPNWKAYAARRFFRIYPAYFGTLVVCWVGSWALSAPQEGGFPQSGIYAASAVMVQNWVFDGRQISMNPSLWSIPVEAELYFVYPLLLWIFFHYGLKWSLVFTLICSAFGLAMFLLGLGNPNGSFFKYALIWSSGAWLAERYASQRLPKWSSGHAWALLAVFILTLLAGFLGVDVFFVHYGWGLFSFLLVWWVLGPGSLFFSRSAPWVRILAFTGTISYSIYLLHFPLFRLAGAAWVSMFGSKPDSFFIPTLATLLVVPVAWVFFRVIEMPSHQIGRRLGRALQVTS
ncbi:MAG: acyltransferase [Verrucomicrobia bacterium]|nr:acyltransferase [Verrucomicrobiota bacterium]